MANLTPEEILRGIIDGSLTEINDSIASAVGQYRLGYMPLLEEASVTRATVLQEGTFCSDQALSKLYLPMVQSLARTFAFRYTSVPVIALPSITTIYMNNFTSWTGTTLDFGENFKGLPNFGLNGIANNAPFNKFILRRKDAIVTMTEGDVLSSTGQWPSNRSGGTLYVPQALIASYQSATNWSTILGYTNNQILPIEGSEYEHYYADGTPIPSE